MTDGETNLKRAIWLKSWGRRRCISDYMAGRQEAPWSSSLHHLLSVRIEWCLSSPAVLAILDFFLLFWSHLAYSIYLLYTLSKLPAHSWCSHATCKETEYCLFSWPAERKTTTVASKWQHISENVGSVIYKLFLFPILIYDTLNAFAGLASR